MKAIPGYRIIELREEDGVWETRYRTNKVYSTIQEAEDWMSCLTPIDEWNMRVVYEEGKE